MLYCDLKCENIFLDEGNNVKFIDFGFFRLFKKLEICKIYCGLVVYVVYEILRGKCILY